MLSGLKEQLQTAIAASLKEFFPNEKDVPSVELDAPGDKSHGDLATNIALKSAKVIKKPPMVIAEEFCRAIRGGLNQEPLAGKIEKIEPKQPGFINFFFAPAASYDILEHVLDEQDNYGRSDFGKKTKMQIEFVSANPTGPLSVAHARQAAVGDALVNILRFLGFDAFKEFYVNDEGNQINILGNSICCRALEELGEKVDFPEDGYQGDYIRDMAREFLERRKIKDSAALKKIPADEFRQYGVDYLMDVIKQELDDFGVHFDVWSHQSKLATPDKIEEVLGFLKEKGFLYEKEGALWFRTTDLGDDKDRVLRKSDGAYTYFTPDIAYHKNKFSRGFQRVVNIWGPDHHGYIPRLTAAVQALGKERDALQVLIVQLATIYRDGKPVHMSTRRGQFISLREVLDEVGADAARYFFLQRHIKAHLDFDLELAKKETPENPVYYIQYAHARIHSIVAKARETGLSPKKHQFRLLKESEELDVIKKVGYFPDTLRICHKEMDPFALVSYLHELATAFHKFYDCHRVVDPDNAELSMERLGLIEAVRIVLANGLGLLGINRPVRM